MRIAPRGSRVSARKDNSRSSDRNIAGEQIAGGKEWKRMIKGMVGDVYSARRTGRTVDEPEKWPGLNPPHALTQRRKKRPSRSGSRELGIGALVSPGHNACEIAPLV